MKEEKAGYMAFLPGLYCCTIARKNIASVTWYNCLPEADHRVLNKTRLHCKFYLPLGLEIKCGGALVMLWRLWLHHPHTTTVDWKSHPSPCLHQPHAKTRLASNARAGCWKLQTVLSISKKCHETSRRERLVLSFLRSCIAKPTLSTAIMSANSSLDLLASGGRGKSSRTLLRVVILLFIAGAAVASRLFSVIRKSRQSPGFTVK